MRPNKYLVYSVTAGVGYRFIFVFPYLLSLSSLFLFFCSLLLLQRYDDNIRFVKTELMPLLSAERSKMAEKYGGDWQVRASQEE